jgi:histidine triad (HIT) family protein
MTCLICEMIDGDKHIIYQDKLAVAILVPNPAVEGHIMVAPREHYAIVEQVPDEVMSHLFIVANRVSSAVFELLGAQGSNITVNNGIPAGQELPHLVLNILPRKENDALNFKWAPKQISQQDMQVIAAKVKDKCDYIGHEAPKEKPMKIDEKKEIKADSDEDYTIKQLERIP